MEGFIFLLRRLYYRFVLSLRRLFQRETNFEKLLKTFKDDDMNITTITQLIDAFRAETAQDAITPDSLGQLLQKIVNILGDTADANTVQQLQTWATKIKNSQSLIKNIRAENSSEALTFYIDKVNASTGNAYTESLRINYPKLKLVNGAANGFYLITLTNEEGTQQYSQIKIYGATPQYAGIMTAADKVALDDLSTWQPKVKNIGSVVKSLTVAPDEEKMFIRLQKGNLADGLPYNDNVLIPHVSATKAGAMSAQDYNNLQALVEQSEQAANAKSWLISVETRGNKLFLDYPRELTQKGYVPYLLRYSVRSTTYRLEEGEIKRKHGPKRKGWHRYYDQNAIKLEGREVLIGRRVYNDEEPAFWDYNGNGPRQLFGQIKETSTGQASFYNIAFGKKIYTFPYKRRYSHRFKFGIVFAPPITEEKHIVYPWEWVTNVAPFQVTVLFDSAYEDQQDARDLHFYFSV